jgi:hypothetical protein
MFAKRLALAAGLLALLAGGYAVAGDAELTGTWNLTVQTAAGAGNPTLVLEQDGNSVTGTYRGQLGESPVEGTVNGSEFELTFNVSSPMGAMDVRYAGEITDDQIQGTVAMGQLGQGSFTGTRQ